MMLTEKSPSYKEIVDEGAKGNQFPNTDSGEIPPRPVALHVIPENIPAELRASPRWMNWKYEWIDGKWTKPPYIAGTNQNASSTNQATWREFETALAAYQRGGYDGIGFAGMSDLAGCDLDHVTTWNGETLPWTTEQRSCKRWQPDAPEPQAIVDGLGSYAERSPSGTGIRIYARGGVGPGTKSGDFEIYSSGRYLTVTGHRLPGSPETIEDAGELAAKLAKKFGGGEKPKAKPKAAKPKGATSLSAFEVVIKATAAKNGDKFKALMGGSCSGYKSQSEADAALCMHLAYWTGGDASLMDQIFRTSGLLRDKWDESHSGEGETYGSMTISSAIAKCSKFYGEQPPVDPDVNIDGITGQAAVCAVEEEEEEEASCVEPDLGGKLPPELLDLPGDLGELLDLYLYRSKIPQPAALGSLITMLGTVTGRVLTDVLQSRTNAMVFCLGETGSGKDDCRDTTRELLTAAGAEKMLGPERIGSAAGLITAVDGSPAILFQIDEGGQLLKACTDRRKAAPHMAGIVDVLTDLFTKSKGLWIGDAYADAKKVKRIPHPHPCVYGTSTPEVFWQSLTPETAETGFIGRLMVFECDDRAKKQIASIFAEDRYARPLPVPIVKKLKDWADYTGIGDGNLSRLNPTPCVAVHSPEAQERFLKYINDIDARREKESRMVRALWARTAEKAGKLALIFAAWCGKPGNVRIELEHMNAAIRIVNFLTRRMVQQCEAYVSENAEEQAKLRILRYFNGDKEMSGNQLTRKTQWMNERQRKEAVNDLVQAGRLLSRDYNSGTKTGKMYRKA